MKPEGKRLASLYLDGEGGPELQEELSRYLKENPEELDEFLELVRDHAALSSVLAPEQDRLASLVTSALRFRDSRDAFAQDVQEAVRRKEAAAPRARRRGSRRNRERLRRSTLIPVVMAAGVLFAIVVLMTLSPSKPTRPEREEARAGRRSGPVKGAEPRPVEGERNTGRQGVEQPATPHLKAKDRPKTPEQDKASPEANPPEGEDKQDDLKKKAEKAFARAGARRREAPEKARTKPPDRRSTPPVPVAPKEDATRTAIATLERAAGRVFVLSGGERMAVAEGRGILGGHGLETTGPASRAGIRFTDGTQVELRGDTLVREVKIEGGKHLVVVRGEVRAKVGKQPLGKPMVFETPHAEATVLGTTLRIRVDAGSTRLEVTKGKVRLKRKSDGKTVLVMSGHHAVASPGVALAPKRNSIDEIVLLPREARVAGTDWQLVKDTESSTGHALEVARDLKRPLPTVKSNTVLARIPSRLTFSFRADADREYRIWIRARCTGTDREFSDSFALEPATGSFTRPCPRFGVGGDNAFLFDWVSRQEGYWWVGGNEGASRQAMASVRFTQSGPQVIRLYAFETPLRIDAIWLSATQKNRPAADERPPLSQGK